MDPEQVALRATTGWRSPPSARDRNRRCRMPGFSPCEGPPLVLGLATPIVAVTKIILERIEVTAPVARVLAGRLDEVRPPT